MCKLRTLQVCVSLEGTDLFPISGEYTWSSYIGVQMSQEATNTTAKMGSLPVSGDIWESSQQFSLTLLSLKKVFTPVLYRGILGFMTWWLCAVWFSTSAIGLVYYSYGT